MYVEVYTFVKKAYTIRTYIYNLEAVNVHYENLLSFQILRNYNHGNKDDASREA